MTSVHPPHEFATTQWSVVVRGGARGSQEAEAALATLCRTYWFPLYSYVRRSVTNVHEAQDLTQAFFGRLLEKNAIAIANPERGRFRSFLLTALKNFLANEWQRGQTQKRGGGKVAISLDVESGESRLHQEPAHELTAERLYERHWALTLLEQVVKRLEQEWVAAGKQSQFGLLKESLTNDRLDYKQLSAALSQSEDATRQAVHRLRKRYRELLRAEVAETVDDPAEVEQEIHNLIEILGS